MLTIDSDTREALVETLDELKHDLGKYIKLPVAMLPKDAPKEALAEQIIIAVEETRRGPTGVLTAQMLYDRFSKEWGGILKGISSYERLKEALGRAYALVPIAKTSPNSLSRDDVEARLFVISELIAELMMEVDRG